MKVLILGATGMAGHVITLYLKEKGHEVYALSRKLPLLCNGIECDVMETDILKSYIENGHFEAVINCVGILNTACDEQISKAVFVNSYLPHFLAETVKGTQTKLIHLSTDCVFSGERGRYNEDDLPDGASNYDRSKALGEINDCCNLTFRNSIIGPDMRENGIGLFNWFMKQGTDIYGYTKVMWNGVTTLVLAQAIEVAMRTNLHGIYHLVNSESISKYNLLQLFNKHFKNQALFIRKKDDIFLDKSLVNNREDFSFKVPAYETMIIEMKNWIMEHKQLYPHYRIEG